MIITLASLLFGAHMPPSAVLYRTNVWNSSGLISSPAVRMFDKTTATLKTSVKGQTLEVTFTPQVKEDGRIMNRVRITLTSQGSKERTRTGGAAVVTSSGQDLLFTISDRVEFTVHKAGTKIAPPRGDALLVEVRPLLDLQGKKPQG
jgi:hypothetical protein